MKGTMLWRLGYLCCALAGCLAGYGIVALTDADDIKPNTITKDNTLVREADDSVFFDAEKAEIPVVTVIPEEPGETDAAISEVMPAPARVVPAPTAIPAVTPTEAPTPELQRSSAEGPEEPEEGLVDKPAAPEDTMPSLGSQWANTGLPVPTPFPDFQPVETENQVAETITYPAKIFGQVPVINRSDTYVSYFEFAYDLIAMLEPEVKARGLNMNALLTKFALKALFCGVDIEKLDINAPIPRRLAALCLWLAAQVLNEVGCDTSAKSAQNYVVDISGCSSAEKKAVAYLYEQGILKGYQTAGQNFYPDAGLKTESGVTWLSRVKQCWK